MINRNYCFVCASDDLVQSPLTSENFIRTRRWSAPKQTGGDASHSEIEEITPLKRTPGLNSSSHALNRPSAALSPAIEYVHGRMDLKPLSDTFSTNEMKVNLNRKNMDLAPPHQPDSKRLSVCSNSTELILLEADRMISATQGLSKQKLTSPPTFTSRFMKLSLQHILQFKMNLIENCVDSLGLNTDVELLI